MKNIILAAAMVGFSVPAMAEDITMDQVPQVVKDAVAAAAPGATFDKIEVEEEEEEEDGKKQYTFTAKGLQVDAFDDGSIEEVETGIEASALPEAVTKVLNEKLPGFEPSLIEKSTRPDNVIFYELEGTRNGKDIEAELMEDGTEFETDDETAS